MRSVLLQLGPFTVYSYGLMLAVGVMAAMAVIRPRAAAVGLGEERLFNLAAAVFAAALAGARLTWLILAGERVGSLFQSGHGGLSFFGGLAFGAIVLFALAGHWHLAASDLTDAVVPGLAIGEALARLGCDIFGKPTAGWWAIGHGGATVHPVQLYSFALNLGIYLILTVFRPRHAGQVGAVYLVALGITRFLLEFFREGATIAGPFTWGHLAALSAFLGGVFLFLRREERCPRISGRTLQLFDLTPLAAVPFFFAWQ